MGNPKKRIPADLRERLEEARLDGLALFRALDRLDLTAEEIPQDLIHESGTAPRGGGMMKAPRRGQKP